ncbi:unnamed protein product [Danaus chrysippus]|uniref:(African queen) hypothetical protein n=1 Tax=Danaus chrysippus TaxID=151541 RepID=A0A8J2QQQ8_9NEOP|nr:unnamed protein product [Danaus chrysippus]
MYHRVIAHRCTDAHRRTEHRAVHRHTHTHAQTGRVRPAVNKFIRNRTSGTGCLPSRSNSGRSLHVCQRQDKTDRPYSESDVERQSQSPQQQHCRRSASSPPLTLTFDSDLEDDVFSPRTDAGNDRFSTTNLEIFRYGRTPAGVLLSPRRERSFTFSVTSEKHWRDKGGTDVADGVVDEDVVCIKISILKHSYTFKKLSNQIISES